MKDKKWTIIFIISLTIILATICLVGINLVDVYTNGITNMSGDKFYGNDAIKNLMGWIVLLLIFSPKYLFVVIIFIISVILLIMSISKMKKLKKLGGVING